MPCYLTGQQQVGQQAHRDQTSSNYLGSTATASASWSSSSSEPGRPPQRPLTIENFIALIRKIEANQPRLANQPDQLIRMLLGRFRLDNYYYDTRARTPVAEQDHRTLALVPAIFAAGLLQTQSQSAFMLSSEHFPEHLLSGEEKCSMYFMLSHFVEKQSTTMASVPAAQLAGPDRGQRPPVLQAAAAQSDYRAPGAERSPPRYPAQGYGSPQTANMNSFGAGMSNLVDTAAARNPFGVNSAQPVNQLTPSNLVGRPGALMANRYQPYLDGQARAPSQSTEWGVVQVGGQEGGVVLNRVLSGILAGGSMPPQSIRQLGQLVYPSLTPNTQRIDDELDPLFALTLADLWALSAQRSSSDGAVRLVGELGKWNSQLCPSSYQVSAGQVRFSQAELAGGLDGFNLGLLRRRLEAMRKPMRLSELLQIYYSRLGFRPQFPDVGVCTRGSPLSGQLDELRRQAETYLRLYQLNLPVTDADIATGVARVQDAFRELLRQAASSQLPELCREPEEAERDQCELPRSDLVVVLDSSSQANQAFMAQVVARLARRLNLIGQHNSLTLLTDQQDSAGYAGAYSFNALLRNSTNVAQVGCALTGQDNQIGRAYGGQVSDPVRLVEMFERALVQLDNEFLARQTGNSYSSGTRNAYISSMQFQSEPGPSTKTTGGATTILWFHYGQLSRPAPLSAGPTSWASNQQSQQPYGQDQTLKFQEAKRYLRENFRGASLLVASNQPRDELKPFVFDEARDIFSDIPPESGQTEIEPIQDQALESAADRLTKRLLERMCDVPALFQYPLCFRQASEGVQSSGYLSPGRKQHWMMAPKSFFASRQVRLAFRVEGGRLRVCFGRMPKPDETALRNPQGQTSAIAFGQSNSQTQLSSVSSSDYYTGLEFGVCKDVAPGQEVDFLVSDPCYKKSIADCDPFYFTLTETSNQGETDPNYLCRDEACTRLDQVKFTLSHTGILCNSAWRTGSARVLLLVSIALGSSLALNVRPQMSVLLVTSYLIIQQVAGQAANPQDFGQNRYGEKRGNLTPSEVVAIILLVMTIVAGLALTVGLCYYVTKQSNRNTTKGAKRVPTDGF